MTCGAAHEAGAEGDHVSEHLSINVFHARLRNMELSPGEGLLSKRGAVTTECWLELGGCGSHWVSTLILEMLFTVKSTRNNSETPAWVHEKQEAGTERWNSGSDSLGTEVKPVGKRNL